MNKSTMHQIELLLQSNFGKQDVSKRIDLLVAILSGLGKGNESVIYQALKEILNTETNELVILATAIVDYVFAPVKSNVPVSSLDDVRKSYITEVYKQLKDPVYKDDTNSVVSELKKLGNTAIRENRRGVFERANFQTMDAANSYDDERKNGYVIWRARTQADGHCKVFNGRVMTNEEFKERYPVHYNCMCTAELIPQTMSFEKAMKRKYKEK